MSDMSVVETFGERLKELMEIDGYNNTMLGSVLGVDRKTVGRWVLNQHTPNYIALIKLAKHFHVSVDYLLGETGYTPIIFPMDFDLLQVQSHFSQIICCNLEKESFSENAFCKILVLEHNSVSKWIKNGGMPEAQTFIKLSRVMGITIDALLGIE